MSDLEVAVSASALGVDDSLGDTLSSELSELVNEVEVLDEEGAVSASTHRVLVVIDGVSVRSGQSLSLHGCAKRLCIEIINYIP